MGEVGSASHGPCPASLATRVTPGTSAKVEEENRLDRAAFTITTCVPWHAHPFTVIEINVFLKEKTQHRLRSVAEGIPKTPGGFASSPAPSLLREPSPCWILAKCFLLSYGQAQRSYFLSTFFFLISKLMVEKKKKEKHSLCASPYEEKKGSLNSSNLV